MGTRWFLIAAVLVAAGCNDNDTTRPVPPRGVYTVTGDGEVFVNWIANTEHDVVGYHIYEAACASGGGCPYDRVGTTSGTHFTVTGLANGVTRYYAVTAFDRDGNESELSEEVLFDTPRPEGFDRVLNDYLDSVAGSGYDFSAYAVRDWDDPLTDIFFGSNGGVNQMFAADTQTDIQDAGVASNLDAVDFAPTTGWSPSGSVELIVGHCYVVWTRTDNYAKFRVTDIVPGSTGVPDKVVFDWAYQIDPGNRELRAGKVKDGERGATRPIVWLR